MDWAANVLVSTLPSPHPHPRSRVYSSAPADELRVGQVPNFHQLYVFHDGLFAAGFFEGYSTRQENMVRQDPRSRVVPGRVGVVVRATFCFCGVYVLSPSYTTLWWCGIVCLILPSFKMSNVEQLKTQAIELGFTRVDVGQYVLQQQQSEREERARERKERKLQEQRGFELAKLRLSTEN
ncbi:hypothetical protein E2C01_072716 [Portunus trituberculatus]|uniref:Uncharacterized protein n=1 Tax=Portunus trituberculatus TaxID=210409 RepID=A0A5B7I3A2_PORTR|nr:hypothetical protein [Portunus trituberculatus]